jgi:hypothetical protein
MAWWRSSGEEVVAMADSDLGSSLQHEGGTGAHRDDGGGTVAATRGGRRRVVSGDETWTRCNGRG